MLRTHKETSCFHTGLWADNPPKRDCVDGTTVVVELGADGEDLLDDIDEDGVLAPLFLPRFAESLEPIAPRAVRAMEEPFLDKFVAVPFTSLSSSVMGPRLTNSLCSNWTTT